MIPQDGYVTFDHFKQPGKPAPGAGLARARALEIIKRVSPYERIMNLDTVRFWLTQLNDPGHKHTDPRSSTKRLYLGALTKFDRWLAGRSFKLHKMVQLDGEYARQPVPESFGNVEELLECAMKPSYGAPAAQRVIHEYLASQLMASVSTGARVNAQAAIKSYFDTNDVALSLRKTKKNRADEPADDELLMTLGDFYKMVQNGRPSITMRTVMLIMLQSGMDASTISDRFNYDGYSQIVKYFKTSDHKAWDLSKCPVPIKLVRVKTDMRYTTFIDHDAVVQLQEYLTWKETKYGIHDGTKPLFTTKQKGAIHARWVSKCFSEAAVRAGIQEKASHRSFKIRSHKVRHLLKSILITSGCAQYAAEHVLGHAPKDSYEKQAILYPEMLRAEYAKASSRINIFSKVESILNNPKDPESQEARIRELEVEVRELTQAKAAGGERNDFTSEMNEKMNYLLHLFGALPDDIKKKMSDNLDG